MTQLQIQIRKPHKTQNTEQRTENREHITQNREHITQNREQRTENTHRERERERERRICKKHDCSVNCEHRQLWSGRMVYAGMLMYVMYSILCNALNVNQDRKLKRN